MLAIASESRRKANTDEALAEIWIEPKRNGVGLSEGKPSRTASWMAARELGPSERE